jgi:hypothetical protein
VETCRVGASLPRSKHTDRLIRILNTLDARQTPFAVKQLYVFGSYARGALAPNDLDLLVIHEPIPQPLLEKWINHFYERLMQPRYGARSYAISRCESLLGKAIRRPGEKIDILYETDADRALESLLGRHDAKLLWADEDRDWKPKLESIRPDINAGTAPRPHIVSVKRIADHREAVDHIVEAIAHDEIRLTRISLDQLPSSLNKQNRELFANWQRTGAVGKESMKLLPYVLAYFQTIRQQADYIDGGELSIWSRTFSTLVQFGKPRLWHAVYYLRRNAKLKRVAFLLHLKQAEPNEVLVFERGANWKSEKIGERDRA